MLWCLLAYAATTAAYEPGEACRDHAGAGATVRHVIDGDTLILADGDHVRLLGIDTPELGRDGTAPQPGAESARAFLYWLAGPGTRIALADDLESRDRYRRRLAHVLLEDGTNLQERLLAGGHAVPLVFPPNVRFADCYGLATAHALAGRLGLWALPGYQPRAARGLAASERGYRLVTGRVTATGRSRYGLWLDVDGGLTVRVAWRNAAYFEPLQLPQLAGRRITVRGRLDARRGRPRMTLHHPVNLLLHDGPATGLP